MKKTKDFFEQEYVIKNIESYKMTDTNGNIVFAMDILPNIKYCIHCTANNTCAMSRLFSYAEQCDRYPNGPGFTRDDKEYQLEIKSLYDALKNENSELNKQLKQLLKTAKLEI